LRESTGKRQKNLSDRSWKKKRRNLAENYLGSLRQNCYMGGAKGDTKKRERKNGTRIGTDRKISWDEES